jgi:hypothetical protein
VNNSFPSLDNWIAPPPLPAILAILMVLGFKHLGERLCGLLFRGSREPLNVAASFVLAVAIIAAGLQLMLVAWRVPVELLKALAWSLGALGVVELWLICTSRKRGAVQQISSFFLEQQPFERAALLLLATTALCFALMALGPPTDADSLDYHLGVPLEFLRRGEAYPRYDWFHARLIGSGEVLNMLGLAGGTDILGAVLSAAGLAALARGLAARVRTSRDRILILSCLITCPFLLFVLPNQKPFFLPAAANTLALLIVVDRFRTLDVRTLFVILGCSFFAMSCKYSFLLSGSVVLLMAMAGAYRSRRLTVAIGVAFLCYLVLLFPMQWQKLLFYGDPISPMLEQFKEHGNAPLVRFAQFLREYTMSSFPFPVAIVVPYSLGSISSVLGVGALACLVAIINVRVSNTLIIAAFCAITINYIAGARSAGYFLEPYLWLAIAAAAAPWGISKTLFYKLLMVQAAVMVLIAGFGAISLFPGALTSGLRSHVMKENSHQYAVMRWLDSVLPEDAVVVSTLRSHALMPRPFFAKDIITWTDWASSTETENTVSVLKTRTINTLVAEPFAVEGLTGKLGMQHTLTLAGPRRFLTATRNPWNRTTEAPLAVYGVWFAREADKPNSGLLSGR